jgi:polyribonucleotide nucleotidyltransferase
VGDKVKVHLLEIHDDGKMRLTRKPFIDENGAQDE